MDDWQLLKDYATTKSEQAFRALVERYAGMVYHAALRQTGNPGAAEEAAQVVFITLAQKAGRVPRQSTLYGWLFRATRYAVLNQARANANRERHEQEALAMQSTAEPTDAESLWERVTPHLNDALDKLPAADREVVMIRYFGNKSHRDVAEALGVSEETARKRLSRAIERLRVILARRGVVVSSVALAAAFAVCGAQAAPVQAASSWATVAMAKAASCSSGLFALMTCAKVSILVVAIAGSMVLVTMLKSNSGATPVAALPATNLPTAAGNHDTNDSVAEPVVAPKPAVSPLALDKVKAALHDLNPTSVYPNSVMQGAIAGLGDGKKTALPILEAALNEPDPQVRLRAIDGLGIIGAEAKDAAPLLLGVARGGGLDEAIPQTDYAFTQKSGAVTTRPIYTDNIIVYALAQIRPSPEILPELARMMKENRSVYKILVQATQQFPGGLGRTMPGGGLWGIAGEDSKALNHAFGPLLQDPDRAVRYGAASLLVSVLGDQADPGVFPVALDVLKYSDGINNDFGRRQQVSLLMDAARDLSVDGPPGNAVLNAPRLGPYLNETVSALADVAYHTAQDGLRMQAWKMLDVLVPAFRKSNPQFAAELEHQMQTAAFTSKVMNDEASRPEILEGLKKFPKAAPAIAARYARNGSNVVELLPAFREALLALAPSPETSGGDRTTAVNMRQQLANAMQKIAPGMPKPIFTASDSIALTRIMNENNPALQADPDRLQKVSAARNSAAWPSVASVGGIFDVSPEEVRRLLAAVKDADAATFDALVAKVNEIDPHFFEKGN